MKPLIIILLLALTCSATARDRYVLKRDVLIVNLWECGAITYHESIGLRLHRDKNWVWPYRLDKTENLRKLIQMQPVFKWADSTTEFGAKDQLTCSGVFVFGAIAARESVDWEWGDKAFENFAKRRNLFRIPKPKWVFNG